MRLFVATLLLSGSAFAQTTLGTASLSGTVRDSAGAVVNGARVVLTEEARALIRESVSNDAGLFTFPSIPATSYTLRITKEGFDTYELKGLQLEVGQSGSVEAELKVGQISSVVSVTAERMVALETESNVLGTVVDAAQVESLPLNGRNFLQLALIAAGSNEPTGRGDNTGQVGHPGRGVVINGNMPTTTGYLINGISTRGGRLGESALNLSVASIDQFKVQQSFFPPDQGPNPGLVNVTTKGGSNRIHGQAFEYVRNEIFDARNFFAPEAEDLKRNQFGFALGGPIVKDRTWFYANYEGLREITAFSARGYAPTQAMFGGNLSEVPEQIFDPATYNAQTGTRSPFPGRIIPDSRINAVSKKLLQYYLPGSSLSLRPSNVFGNPRNTLDDDQWGLRLDHSISMNQQIFGQFVHQNSPAIRPGLFPLSGASYPNETHFAMVQHTWTISPSLVNVARAGFTRQLALFGNEGASVGNITPGLGINNTFDTRGVTSVGIQGYSGFGRANGDLGNIDNNYQLDEGMNWIRGKHNFQFGTSFRYRRTWQQNANAGAHGNLNFQPIFSSQLTRNAAGQTVTQPGTGNAFADFLLGTPQNASVAGLPMFPYRFTQYMPYFQDTWKVHPTLTINWGMSWFLATVPDPQGAARRFPHGFDYSTGLLKFAALGEVDPRVMATDRNNFVPRVGFAWKPKFLPNTVIRAGGGIYYSDSALIEAQFAMVAPPFNTTLQLFNPPANPQAQYVLGQNIFPAQNFPALDSNFAAALPNGTTAFLLQPDGRTPYVSQWNVSIQHQLANESLLEFDYVGNSAHRLQNRYDISQCRPGADLRCDPATKPYPRYSGLLQADFNGNSSYHALFAKYHHRMRQGLNLRVEYAFSKALDDNWESGTATEAQITACRRCDKGHASFDQRHRAVISTIWDLPFGRGRQFGSNLGSFANAALGGWTLTGITTFGTGAPVFISGPARTQSIYISHRPNRVCDGRDSSLASNLRNNGFVQFNTACFADAPQGFFGNTGRSPIHGPGLHNWDAGIEKFFPIPIREAMKLQFRTELFNAFNHANFGSPNGNLGAGANFGRVAGARAPRLIQMSLKLLW
ncbi:MAG: carboxypeptidase-like regulatory domain-containing protein [Bryobacteraceae bacterium]|nr:carboxypeptidase-like regulatory domain-containing protein [Bryobacteraceae bacterium]